MRANAATAVAELQSYLGSGSQEVCLFIDTNGNDFWGIQVFRLPADLQNKHTLPQVIAIAVGGSSNTLVLSKSS